VTVRVNDKKSEIYAFFFAEISIKVTADKVLSWRMILGVIRSLLIARMSVVFVVAPTGTISNIAYPSLSSVEIISCAFLLHAMTSTHKLLTFRKSAPCRTSHSPPCTSTLSKSSGFVPDGR